MARTKDDEEDWEMTLNRYRALRAADTAPLVSSSSSFSTGKCEPKKSLG
jgi:hypothetical protein